MRRFRPTTHKLEDVLCGPQFVGHFAQFVNRFNEIRFVIRLNVHDRICIALNRSLAQSFEIAIQMNPGTCGDVSAIDLIRMTQVWHVFLSRMLPRIPNYVFACKFQIRHLDAGRGQKTV